MGASTESTRPVRGYSAALMAMAGQLGSPTATEAGATRRLGWSSQSISWETTARLPVSRMKAMKIDSFSPTHW